MNVDRTCLACKGSGHTYNYQTYKFTSELCGCCKDGRVPFESADDGFGPFTFIQHIRTTDIMRGETRVGTTTDVREPSIHIEDATIRLTGLITVRELEGIAALLVRIRESGANVNCSCPGCRCYSQDKF